MALSLAYSTPPMEKCVRQIFQQNARYICIQAHENKAGASHPFRQMGICPTKNLLWKKDKRNKRKEGKKKRKKAGVLYTLKQTSITEQNWSDVATVWCLLGRWWPFPRVQGLGENVQQFITHLRFFFFKVEISLCTLIPLFRPGSVHSGSASWDECDWVFPDDLHVSSFPDRFPHYAWTAV